MCGRYNILPDSKAWVDAFAVFGELLAAELKGLSPRYNVAPTQEVPIIVSGADGEAEIVSARWGLIPTWWQKSAPPTLTTNVRAETAASKPMWREAWAGQRCLIPASSWYEWFDADVGSSKSQKIPHLLERDDGKQIFFAGLWSWFQPSVQAPARATCAIVTIASAPQIAEIHARTPVVLKPEHWPQWLGSAPQPVAGLRAFVEEGAVEHFRIQTVARTVSNARNTGPECLAPQAWPEMTTQGQVHYSSTQLRWLRSAPAAEVRYELLARLEVPQAHWPPVAERRLWLRELSDRDDAEWLAELLQQIRSSLKAKTPPSPAKLLQTAVAKAQGELF